MKKHFLKLTAVALILMTAFVACDKDNPNDPNNPNNPTNPTDSLNDVGVKINGVTWATRNVNKPGTFAAKPEDFGMFYQWNRPVGWSTTDPMKNSNNGTVWDSSTPTGDSWTNNICPSGWRVPTLQELEGFLNSDKSWGVKNGVNGYWFGTAPNQVFFPAAGTRSSSIGTLDNQDAIGYYWSSTPNGSELACRLHFSSDGAGTYVGGRRNGFSVRCVKE